MKVILMGDVQENGVRKRDDMDASFVMVYIDEVRYVTISQFHNRPMRISIPKGGYFIAGDENDRSIVLSVRGPLEYDDATAGT